MVNIAIFASGSGTNAENLIRYFSKSKQVKIKLVITNNAEAGIVKKAEALKKTVQIISKEALNSYTYQIVDFLQAERVDIIVLAGFLLKIPPALIKAFPHRIINIHPSLLPKYGGKGMYGKRVHESVIEAGEINSGITVHYIDEEYDRGTVIMQVACPVKKDDTPETLSERIHNLEYIYLPRAIEKVITEKK